MKIAPLAARCACGPHARCACGRTGPAAALAPLFRDNIRATTMTTAATPPTAAMELHTTATAMIISVCNTAEEKRLPQYFNFKSQSQTNSTSGTNLLESSRNST